jgi:hypothetical protein
MKKMIFPVALAALLLVAVFGFIQNARGQVEPPAGGRQVLKSETLGETTRVIDAPSVGDSPQSPDIGFIDSPSATCYQPDPGKNECFINWYYLSVSASPNYMITMTAILNNFGPVAHVQGFFQTSMYVPYNMLDRGFKVSCGALGAGGNLGLGNAYAYTIKARDSAGLKSANYGTVYCPAYKP